MKIPSFKFDFLILSPGDTLKLLGDDPSAPIVIIPPNSYFRKTVPNGFSIKDREGRQFTSHSGFRSQNPISQKKPADTYRVIAIGDSFTWGAALDDRQTWPFLLEQKLREKSGKNIEVLNGGIVSSSIINSYESLENYDVNFQPDTVILTFCENDIDDLTKSTSITPFEYEFLKKFHSISMVRFVFGWKYQTAREKIKKAMKSGAPEMIAGRFGVKEKIKHITWPNNMHHIFLNRHKIPQTDINRMLWIYYYAGGQRIMPYTEEHDFETHKLWQTWENELIKIRELGKKKGFHLIVHVYPIYARIFEKQFDDKKTPENIITEICKRNGIDVVNPLQEFRKRDPDFMKQKKYTYLYPMDSHPSVYGNDIVSDSLIDPVLTSLKLKKN